MDKSPHERRKFALELLRRRLGRTPEQCISVSRFYPAGKSWTRSPVWWFDLPLSKLQGPKCSTVYLMCEKEVGSDFIILKVPASHVLDNLNSLCIAKNQTVRLHLSARQQDLFVDLRGKPHLAFAQWAM